jgi:predicted  nucleic acid-binding Zn-ribbon protein
VTNIYEEALEEARQRLANVEGELASVRTQLAMSTAVEAQLRQELVASETEAALAGAELAHARRDLQEQKEIARRRISELEEALSEARRIQQHAEHERAAVIAALGRRARRHLTLPSDEEDGPEEETR